MDVRTRTSTSDSRLVVGATSVQIVGSSSLFFRHGSLGILSGGIHEVLSLLREQSKFNLSTCLDRDTASSEDGEDQPGGDWRKQPVFSSTRDRLRNQCDFDSPGNRQDEIC